ncbi:MAG: HlyD family secretion protein [Acidobacteriota bacterium]
MALQKKWIALSVLLALATVGAAVGYARWRHNQVFVRTENAYVAGRIFAVAAKVPGKIQTLPVEENQAVTAGNVVATLDPRDFDAAVARAEASLAEAEAGLEAARAAIAQASAQESAARSQLSLARTEKDRVEALYRRESLPKQKFDQASTALEVASAQVSAAQKTVASAHAGLQVSEEKIRSARAALEAASLQRSYCDLTAPASGVVSRKTAQVGHVVAAGQPLFAVVPLDLREIWVEANYKETQLRKVRPGQKATIRADVDPSRKFTGTVDSIAAGTGAVFSLLPPENATGNWVKVVQRVPVKVVLDPGTDPGHSLRLGLTVTCEIDTRSGGTP